MLRCGKPLSIIVPIAAVILSAPLFRLPAAAPAGAADALDERLKEIEERLDDLERVVNDDPMYPQRTLDARVEALEDSFGKFEKTGESDARTDQRALDDLEKRFDQHARTTEALARRMTEIEKTPRGDGDVSRELQAQARQLDELEDALQSLEQRIERMEAKR